VSGRHHPNGWLGASEGCIPNILIFLTDRAPSGGTIGSTVNHVGVWVPKTRVMLDHIGFEVENLEAFCKRLEAKGIALTRPITRLDDVKISLA
jgi:hypothetical protein